jgi:hypothetical protein
MLMRYSHPFFLILFSMFTAGWAFTLPAIDSGGYWTLTRPSLDIQFIAKIIAMSASENRRLPATLEELTVEGKNGSGKYLRSLPQDPWRHPYVYKVLDADARRFVVYSAGPDGIDNGGGGDDIVGGAKSYACELYGSCLTAKDYANRALGILSALVLLTWIIFCICSMFKWMPWGRVRATIGRDRPLADLGTE